MEVVFDHASPGIYRQNFLMAKRDGGWCTTIELSTLNTFLMEEHFTMETTTSIMAAMRPGEWTISIDLKYAYFRILRYFHTHYDELREYPFWIILT